MFTGIIQELGTISQKQILKDEMRLWIDLQSLADQNLQLGESIAINGACHTLETLEGRIGQFFSSAETISKTNFRFLQINESVNLELSLKPTSRMGGHFVSGHIDGLAKLISVQTINQSYKVGFEIPSQFQKLVIHKGSICLNGISLTIAELASNCFYSSIIPHTWNNTNLHRLKIGSLLNLEIDLLGKYVQNLLPAS